LWDLHEEDEADLLPENEPGQIDAEPQETRANQLVRGSEQSLVDTSGLPALPIA
jgi:hypothetical protein